MSTLGLMCGDYTAMLGQQWALQGGFGERPMKGRQVYAATEKSGTRYSCWPIELHAACCTDRFADFFHRPASPAHVQSPCYSSPFFQRIPPALSGFLELPPPITTTTAHSFP